MLLLSHWLRACLEPEASGELPLLTEALAAFPATAELMAGPAAARRGAMRPEGLVEAAVRAVAASRGTSGAYLAGLLLDKDGVRLPRLPSAAGAPPPPPQQPFPPLGSAQGSSATTQPGLVELFALRGVEASRSSCSLAEMMAARCGAAARLLAAVNGCAGVLNTKCSGFARCDRAPHIPQERLFGARKADGSGHASRCD